MGRCEKGVTETLSESEAVGKVKRMGVGVGKSRDGLLLDIVQDELSVFMLVEMGRGENGSEEGEEVFPASKRLFNLSQVDRLTRRP